MTLNLPLLYFVCTEEYCQTSPNKNKSPKLWHITSILACCIFAWRYTTPLYRAEIKGCEILNKQQYCHCQWKDSAWLLCQKVEKSVIQCLRQYWIKYMYYKKKNLILNYLIRIGGTDSKLYMYKKSLEINT